MKTELHQDALNDAGWKLLDELQKLMDVVPNRVFNNLKPALAAAIDVYQIKAAPEALSPWTGDGLPPVGLEVEVFSVAKPHHSYAAHVGQRVRIVAHDVLGEGGDEGTPVAVYAFDLSTGTGYHALIAGHFRPIRTAEQIAAEEGEQHRAKYVGQLNKLWDADTKRSEFIEAVYALIVEAGKP